LSFVDVLFWICEGAAQKCLVRIPKAVGCVNIDMDIPADTDTRGIFEARYLAFLETITHLRPSLHR
jgi:hypothetical protein